MASICPSIVIKKGNVLTTSNGSGVLYAQAVIEETFDHDMDIFSLPTLLSMISAIPDADITVMDRQVIVSGNRQKFAYAFTTPGILPYYPPRPESFKWDTLFSTRLSKAEYKSLVNAVSNLKISEFNLVSDGKGDVLIRVHNKKSENHSFEIMIGKSDKKFSAWFDHSHFQIIDDDYELSLNSRQGKAREVMFLLLKSDYVEYTIAAFPEK